MNRRELLLSAAAAATAPMLPAAALADGFIAIETDGEYITSEMPCDETAVEVRLTDGTICRAWYAQNIMDHGDWDFVALAPGQDEPGDEQESIAHRVAAWRPLSL